MKHKQDSARIDGVLQNHDSVYGSTQNGIAQNHREFKIGDGSLAPKVAFEKVIDGSFYAVEAAPDSKAHEMHLISAYIKKKMKRHIVCPMRKTPRRLISKTCTS